MTGVSAMQAEILATGDEIRTGALVDSNSAHIAEALESLGIKVVRHTSLGDDLQGLRTAFGEVATRADLCVVTGGLGPTSDDLTTAAAARAAGVDLVLNAEALAAIEAFFRRLKRPMSDSNRKQALLPAGALMLPNPLGTAPGFALTIGRCRFYCLPGVPPEMRRMLAKEVIPLILQHQGAQREISLVKTLSTFGLPESVVGERVAGVENRFRAVKLGLRAKFPEIQVKLYLHGRDEKTLMRQLEEATAWVRARLENRIFSETNRPMAAVVGELLKARGETVAVAESCTGGLISHWLTNEPGSSAYFLLSAVTYANPTKIDLLGVDPITIDTHGAVSLATVGEMAAGAQRISGADHAIATSGIAGPDGGSAEKPVGTVCVGLATGGTVHTAQYLFAIGNRLMKKKLFAMVALDKLRRHLQRLPELQFSGFEPHGKV